MERPGGGARELREHPAATPAAGDVAARALLRRDRRRLPGAHRARADGDGRLGAVPTGGGGGGGGGRREAVHARLAPLHQAAAARVRRVPTLVPDDVREQPALRLARVRLVPAGARGCGAAADHADADGGEAAGAAPGCELPVLGGGRAAQGAAGAAAEAGAGAHHAPEAPCEAQRRRRPADAGATQVPAQRARPGSLQRGVSAAPRPRPASEWGWERTPPRQ
mmetsp:Transcript_11297/g.28295  ORF Transcript_11297/g.28295 Transcript_11297/m.28295 type:complete len:223 (-) Transcript_11297:1-669(-)